MIEYADRLVRCTVRLTTHVIFPGPFKTRCPRGAEQQRPADVLTERPTLSDSASKPRGANLSTHPSIEKADTANADNRKMRTLFTTVVLCLLVSAALGAVFKVQKRSPLDPRLHYFTRRMAGGTSVDGCSKYPSLVSVSGFGLVVCNGIYINGKVRVPEACAGFIEFFNAYDGGDTTFTAGDGTTSVIPVGAVGSGSAKIVHNADGTADITLLTDLSASCAQSAVLYDPAKHVVSDITTCKVASYGGTSDVPEVLPTAPNETPLVASPILDCCDSLLPSLNNQAIGGDLTSAAGIFTCTTTGASMCTGDLGAPIYCDAAGTQVVAGMMVNSGCTAGETFVSLDFTGGALTGFSKP